MYLKVTIEKKLLTHDFDFSSWKSFPPGQFGRTPTHADITEFSISLLQLKNQRSGSKTMCDFSIIYMLNAIMAL